MRLALIQFNPTVGDITGNAERAARWIDRAAAEHADLVVFPELALVGYPPRDLIHQEGFLEAARDAAAELAHRRTAPAVMLGCPWKPPSGTSGPEWDSAARITNSILVMREGRIVARYDKRLLPTYDVFDEDRYFKPGDRPLVVDVAGVKVGVSVCEDLWKGIDAASVDRYENSPDPVAELVAAGARLIVNPSASPFVLGKGAVQRSILTRHVEKHGIAIAACNQVGGNDDLIFDGHAAVYLPGHKASLIAAGPGFEESIVLADIAADLKAATPAVVDPLLAASQESLLFRALVLGVRDYCGKTGFRSCVLGLSGGIDSALTACIAAAALGPAAVLGVGLPSRFSSPGSIDDARELATRLGIRWHLLPIEGPHAAFEKLLGPEWASLGVPIEPGITEENIQSRIRGTLLMAVSNKTGAILLTTGNKSELAVGYCTLYGDMNGGLAVLSDVTKELVYRLSRWINANPREAGFAAPPIPDPSITKPPSAELKPNQTDQDTLPPYDALDQIIERYVEQRQSAARIIRETPFDPAVIKRVLRMIDISEYKRRQMATGLKVTARTFGPGRRWPIAQQYREI